MRIRKRWPPSNQEVGGSSNGPMDHQYLSTQSEGRPPRLLPPLHPDGDLHSQPTNLLPMLHTTSPNALSLHAHYSHPQDKDEQQEAGEKWVNGEKSGATTTGTNMRNAIRSNVETSPKFVLPPFSSSHQGESADFGIKKKRGGKGEEVAVAATASNGEKKMTQNAGDVEKSTEGEMIKKRGKGSNSVGEGLMEGSRCSRVNGRGWRCSQQTLVGYALCEHHLGKGRLRSMNSVRNRSSAVKNGGDSVLSPLEFVVQEKELLKEEPEHDKVELAKKNKKKKIGMVKARSINSLIDQTDSAT